MKGLSLPSSFKMSTISVLKLSHKFFLFSSLLTHLPTFCYQKLHHENYLHLLLGSWGPGSGVLGSWGPANRTCPRKEGGRGPASVKCGSAGPVKCGSHSWISGRSLYLRHTAAVDGPGEAHAHFLFLSYNHSAEIVTFV